MKNATVEDELDVFKDTVPDEFLDSFQDFPEWTEYVNLEGNHVKVRTASIIAVEEGKEYSRLILSNGMAIEVKEKYDDILKA